MEKNEVLKILGKNINQQMKQKNLKQCNLAELIGTSDEYISLLINGKSGISLDNLVNLFNIGFNPNIIFQDIVNHEDVALDILISNEISQLTQNQKLALLETIKLFKKFNI